MISQVRFLASMLYPIIQFTLFLAIHFFGCLIIGLEDIISFQLFKHAISNSPSTEDLVSTAKNIFWYLIYLCLVTKIMWIN